LFENARPMMKPNRSRTPYAMTAAIFVGIGVGGMLFFGWGEVRLGFLLLIYCLLLLGFRLDEVGRQLASIDRRLADLTARPSVLEPGDPPPCDTGAPSSPEGF
jgi:predicted lipid-binding transport protein (Tim44 family)